MSKNPSRSQVTIQDVANAAGVSITSVSRVLNNKEDVTPEMREKVQRVVDDLGYTAGLAARSLRRHTKYVIGLVLPDVTTPYELAAIQGVGFAIRGSGYDLLIYAADEPPLSRRPYWEQKHVDLLSNGLTDGNIVVTPTNPIFPENARVVVIDPLRDDGNAPSVIATNRVGAIDAMKYLVDLGHRRIGFVTGRSDALSAVERLEGYKAALAEAGIAYDPALVQEGNFTRESGRVAANALLQREDRPTAIFAANDESALGIMEVAGSLGIRIPDDLSIIGFDNIPEASLVNPRLTTVDQSIQQMGKLAAQMLIAWLNGKKPDNIVTVPTHLVVRESCKAI